MQQATEACEKTDWKRAEFIETLAAAYAETGDFETAIKWQMMAIQRIAASDTKTEAEQRLELYRAHQPCREDSSGRLVRTTNAD